MAFQCWFTLSFFCFSVEEWNSSKADLVKTELVLMAGEERNSIFFLQLSNQELK